MEAHMHSMLEKQEKGKNIINIYMCTLSHRLYNIVSIIYKHVYHTKKAFTVNSRNLSNTR